MSLYNLFVLIFLSYKDQQRIRKFLREEFKVPEDVIEKGMHLTAYHSRRPLEDFKEREFSTSILMDAAETRFMVLAPGGENPRPNLKPSTRSVGMRLKKGNIAIKDILDIRRDAYKHEHHFPNRKNTTDWTNAFGARRFQPHIKLMRPGNGLGFDLIKLGKAFRCEFKTFKFSKVAVKIYDSRKQ